MPTHAFTISKLAKAAGVGVEAVRYYQRHGLLSQPAPSAGAFREYSSADVQRLRFIKRARGLGFTVDDVAELISLSSELDKRRVRSVTRRRVREIRLRIVQLQELAAALEGLAECRQTVAPADDCPLFAALTSISSRAASPAFAFEFTDDSALTDATT